MDRLGFDNLDIQGVHLILNTLEHRFIFIHADNSPAGSGKFSAGPCGPGSGNHLQVRIAYPVDFIPHIEIGKPRKNSRFAG